MDLTDLMKASFADTLECDVRCEKLIPEKSSHMGIKKDHHWRCNLTQSEAGIGAISGNEQHSWINKDAIRAASKKLTEVGLYDGS